MYTTVQYKAYSIVSSAKYRMFLHMVSWQYYEINLSILENYATTTENEYGNHSSIVAYLRVL